MKIISTNKWPRDGGIVQVVGTDIIARTAISILKEFDCAMTGWTVTGSRGDRIYTYKVPEQHWKTVQDRISNLDRDLQRSLF